MSVRRPRDRTYILAGAGGDDAERAGAKSMAEEAGVPPPTLAPAGLAVLARGRGVRGAVRAVRHRTAALSHAASTSSRRAARSISPARDMSSASRRQVGLREGMSRTLAWYGNTRWL